MAWRPENNDDVDRDFFNNIIDNKGEWHKVVAFLYKNKRTQYSKEKYNHLQESNQNKKDSKIVPENKSIEDNSSQIKNNESKVEDVSVENGIATVKNLITKEILQENSKAPPQIEIDNQYNNDAHKNIENANKDEEKEIDENLICTICQMDFEEDDTIIELECGLTHIFHWKCLKNWFQVKLS